MDLRMILPFFSCVPDEVNADSWWDFIDLFIEML